MSGISLHDLWADVNFVPNDNQRAAILKTQGPLFLPAGPGSGKTRVLLWRTLNLIVYEGVKPEDIFLSTFTEKAAHQLKQGLQSLLGLVTNKTRVPYDIAPMYIGTLHSLCQRIISDRRFSPNRQRTQAPVLLDDLGQYFFLSDRNRLEGLLFNAGFETLEALNGFLSDGQQSSPSKHNAVTNAIALFNRFSEECLQPNVCLDQTDEEDLKKAIEMYAGYLAQLGTIEQTSELVDFSLLQQRALEALHADPTEEHAFKYVIIDEYQDTNTIQERLLFKLAAKHKNLCVVGDDDQGLYRFRASRVENFVEFPERCEKYLNCTPTTIPLNINYRSRKSIVDFYTRFIERWDWQRENATGYHRITDKNIQAFSTDDTPAVVATSETNRAQAYGEIVNLVRQLLDTGKVQNLNQIAFLFPALKNNTAVQGMRQALETAGFPVYAPRAGRFLEVEEAMAFFGLCLGIFGKPERGNFPGTDYRDFHNWMDGSQSVARELCRHDKQLTHFVKDRQAEIRQVLADYELLTEVATKNGWSLDARFNPKTMRFPLANANSLSASARGTLGNRFFARIIEERIQQMRPFTLGYVINAATSLDWNVLDLFYRLSFFDHFKAMFDLAERGVDEGPICNLGLITQYLARFLDEFTSIITAQSLKEGWFGGQFFLSFLYSLFRLNESEYEDAEDPFPKGRIPFLTVHQSKGLEFPVVVLGSPRKDDRGPSFAERKVRPFLSDEGEPLSRIGGFDAMRMFYVALSRAKNLLVIAHPRGQGIRTHQVFKDMLDANFPRLPNFDVNTVPAAGVEDTEIPRNYSYTSDYLMYQRCPRQYMIFRKYGFVASRSQTQFFGTLVHETLEDLHHLLIAEREKGQAQ